MPWRTGLEFGVFTDLLLPGSEPGTDASNGGIALIAGVLGSFSILW